MTRRHAICLGSLRFGTGFRLLLAIVFAVVLAGCSPPPVPDFTYYRLPPPAPLPHSDKPLTLLPIEIDTFNAEGVYSEQALIYTIADGSALRTYHYQLWSDPPTHALQARLIAELRAAGIAELVTDRLPASTQALRVHGTIRRYDRVSDGKSFKISIAFEIRVEEDEGEPLLVQEYKVDKDAADATLNATVAAFGAAIDEAFGTFYQDLVKLRSDVHAR
jgi:cholesterol transport system auxiliary component